MNCPECDKQMRLIRTIPGKGTSEVREFKCPECGHEEALLYRDGKIDTGK